MVIHLKSLKHTEFLTLSDSDTELSTDIHLLFLDFIKTTNTLREYQKRLFFFDLQTRKTWPSDIAFLDLEHRYPFSPNSEKVFKPDIPFPAIGHEDLIESFTFYINYNTQIDGTTLFQDAFREILRTTFASDSDLQRETLMTWFHDTAQLAHIGPIFAAHTPQFISALDQLHYPYGIQPIFGTAYSHYEQPQIQYSHPIFTSSIWKKPPKEKKAPTQAIRTQLQNTMTQTIIIGRRKKIASGQTETSH
jgi:hypothetical protein